MVNGIETCTHGVSINTICDKCVKQIEVWRGQGMIKESALNTQVGGDHYKDSAIQPIEYIMANGIPFAEGCVIKYVSRWRKKGGVADLKKARHFIDMLIEFEENGVG